MPKGYVIITEDIHDHAGMGAYGRASMPTLAEFGAVVLAADDHAEVVEGSWHGTRTVVVEFATVEAARAWHASPAYQAARQLREAAATSNAVIVAGFTPSGG